jgi:hypothetical protein
MMIGAADNKPVPANMAPAAGSSPIPQTAHAEAGVALNRIYMSEVSIEASHEITNYETLPNIVGLSEIN